MTPLMDVPRERLRDLCSRWKIAELALFGSVLRADFRPESDVDVLVTFTPDARWDFGDLLDLEEELGALVGRKVELVERRLVEENRNYLIRREILSTAQPVYVA